MNCAGIVQVSPVLGTTIDDMERLMAVNFWATVIISQGLLPAMVEQNRGHLINIASASGLVGVPAFVAYGTSKFAVVGYSDGIRNELRESGIRVTTVCPGIVDTPMKSNLNVKGYDTKVLDHIGPGYPVDRLAAEIVRAVQNDTELITPAAKILWFLKRFAPTRAGRYITKQMRVFRRAEVLRSG
jgi:short-subunit dehydrogenase